MPSSNRRTWECSKGEPYIPGCHTPYSVVQGSVRPNTNLAFVGASLHVVLALVVVLFLFRAHAPCCAHCVLVPISRVLVDVPVVLVPISRVLADVPVVLVPILCDVFP